MTNPIVVQGFDHIVLRIADKTRMLAFYTEVLGLTHVRAGSQMIDLITLDGPLGRKGGDGPAATGRNLDHLALQVRPFDEAAIRAHLATHDVPVIEEGDRYGADGDGFSLYIRDPEGNVVELKGPSA